MCATRGPRILFEVTAQSIHLALDVVITDDQPSGQICDGVGQPKRFSGWLGLIAALDGLLGPAKAAEPSRGGNLDKPCT